MAVLPDPEKQQRRLPEINRVVSVPRTKQVSGEYGALRMAGESLRRIGEIEKERLDSSKVTDAVNNYKMGLLDLSKGETGFESAKGGDVLDSEYRTGYEDLAKNKAEELLRGLGSDTQRTRFNQIAKNLSVGFKLDLYNHISTQAESYEKDVFANTLETSRRQAESYWVDDARRKAAVDTGVEHIDEYADRNGMSPEWVSNSKSKFLSDINATVVSQAIAADNYDFAGEYLEKNLNDIDPETAIKLSKTLKLRFAASQSIVSATAYDEANPASSAADARKFFNEQFEDPVAAKTALAEWSSIKTQREEDHTAAQNNIKKELSLKLANRALTVTDVIESGVDAPHEWVDRLNTVKTKGFAPDEVKLAEMRRRINIDPGSVSESEIWDGVLKSWGSSEAQTLSDKRRSLIDSGTEKDDQLKRAHQYLDHARTAKHFSKNVEENETTWATMSGQLDKWRENNPDGDPVEFINKMLEPVRTTFIEGLLDALQPGEPRKEAAVERKRKGIEEEIVGKEMSDWIEKAKERNPGVSEGELRAYYNKKYGTK